MKLKTKSILNVVAVHGKAVLKMDRASVFHQLTITQRGNAFIVGEHPGGKLVKVSDVEMIQQLDDLAMFIEKWS